MSDPIPTPNAAPVSVPVPVPVRSWWGDILTPAAITLLALVMLYAARTPAPAPQSDPTPTPIPAPQPQPQPQPLPVPVPSPSPAVNSPLATAARDYVRGLAGTFVDMARQVRSGQIRDKTAAVELTKSRRQAFTDALDRVFSDNCDTSGNITNPTALADALDQAARATGGTN